MRSGGVIKYRLHQFRHLTIGYSDSMYPRPRDRLTDQELSLLSALAVRIGLGIFPSPMIYYFPINFSHHRPVRVELSHRFDGMSVGEAPIPVRNSDSLDF
jgi:hypothetical protein